MLMKSLWELAAGSDALWVKIVHAKYMPRSDIWSNNRRSRCTVFWKGIMSLRPHLMPWLSWKLGNGHKCKAFAQPWAPGMMAFSPQNAQQRNITVSDLMIQSEGIWDAAKLMQLFGYQGSMNVLSNVSPPVAQDQEDRLIFTPASNGSFSVKIAYCKLTVLQCQNSNGDELPPQLQKEAWRIIWRKGHVVPRLRLFLWKLVNRALPLGAILSARMSKGDPVCAVCGEGIEDATHMVFVCPFARSCWFAGPLSLRTDNLIGNFHQTIEGLAKNLSDDQWTLMANTIWAIWRCRNNKVYSGKLPGFQEFASYLQKINAETLIAKAVSGFGSQTSNHSRGVSAVGSVASQSLTSQDSHCCYTDGSWLSGWRGGIGFVLQKEERLVAYRSAGITSSCSLQAEALALKEAMRYVQSCNITKCVFLTDCLFLSKSVSQLQPPLDTDWQAFEEVLHIWEMLKANCEFECRHISREENYTADGLAKKGSREGLAWDFMGFSYPAFPLV